MPRLRSTAAAVRPYWQMLAMPVRLPRPMTWPFPAQIVAALVLFFLAIPWLARAYAWWWDLAYGGGSFCANFMPLQ